MMFGLSFLNSLFLWGVASASIPLIIHLIKRNRAVRLPFAAMRFLQIRPNQKVKSQKLRQLLLLLMRITALALLALAFARPYLKGSGAGTLWVEQPRTAVILIDNSLSMTYSDNFQSAIAKARELLTSFKPGDKVAVMQFSENATMVVEADQEFELVASQLEQRLAPCNRSTRYIPAIQAAESFLLNSPLESKVIYLISDLQKTGLDNIYSHWELQPGVRLEIVAIEKSERSNVCVKEVLIAEKSKFGGNRDVLVRLKNFGQETKKGALTLNINQRKISERRVTLPAGEEKVVRFQKVRVLKGRLTGFVDLRTDNEPISQDNQYYFVLENRVRTQILAVNGEPDRRDVTQDELFFVERAINLPRVAKYTLVRTVPQRMDAHDLNNYRAVLLVNVKDLRRESVKQLAYFVRGGGGLLMALGDRTNPTIFNRLFRDLSPASLTGLAFDSINRDKSVILAEIDYQHPIFRIFSDPGHGDPSTAQFYQYFSAEPISSDVVLAHFDDGGPAILERKVGDGKVILFTSSLDAEWTNMPVRAIFLPLLYQSLDYVAAKRKGQKSYLVGQPVALENYATSQLNKGDFYVESPFGKITTLESNYFEQTDQPGIYHLKTSNQDRKLGAFAVNIDSRESDLAVIPSVELQNRFSPSSETTMQTAAVTSQAATDQLESRQKMWRFAILAVILLLVGETWLANRTYR